MVIRGLYGLAGATRSELDDSKNNRQRKNSRVEIGGRTKVPRAFATERLISGDSPRLSKIEALGETEAIRSYRKTWGRFESIN